MDFYKEKKLSEIARILELIQFKEASFFSEDLSELFSQLIKLHEKENEVIDQIFNLINNLDQRKHDEIEVLSGLSVRTYNCLTKHTKIKTIADILSFPKERWNYVQGFGAACAKNLEEEMNKIGYTDFKIRLDHNRYK